MYIDIINEIIILILNCIELISLSGKLDNFIQLLSKFE